MIERPTHLHVDGSRVFPAGYDPADLTPLPDGYWEAIDMASARAAALIRIDEQAERIRLRYLTGGAGQALTYQRKEAEARAWKAGDDPEGFPMLAAESAATDATMAETVALVLAQADAWAQVGAAIEGARMGAKKAAREATSVSELDAIDIEGGWSA